MDLKSLQQQLQQPNLAPLSRWNPPFCGDIPLTIKQDGRWFYQNSMIQRPELVKLFASVLIRQQHEYFLLTPVEKVRICVEDAAFLVTDFHWIGTESGPALQLSTNLQHQVLLGPEYPLQLQADPQGQYLPYLQLWHGLSAKLSRNVYYQLAQQAQPVYCNGLQHFQLKSAGYAFTLAIAE